MKPASFYKKAFLGATCLLSMAFSFGIAAGAQSSATPTETPELQESSKRVEQAKIKLDQCRKQLDASRALLRAAEAEYKASIANKTALGLRTQAKQLADLSGLPSHISNSAPVPVVTPIDIQSLPSLGVGTVSGSSTSQTADVPQGGRIDAADFNSQPAPTPGSTMSGNQDAPLPTQP